MAARVLGAAVLIVLVASAGVGAKRGCSAFGHSCFGGHGKRSDLSADSSNSEVVGGQAETVPHPMYPRPYAALHLAEGDDIIPVRDGGAYERDAAKLKLRNILRYWMDHMRRARQRDDAYSFETM